MHIGYISMWNTDRQGQTEKTTQNWFRSQSSQTESQPHTSHFLFALNKCLTCHCGCQSDLSRAGRLSEWSPCSSSHFSSVISPHTLLPLTTCSLLALLWSCYQENWIPWKRRKIKKRLRTVIGSPGLSQSFPCPSCSSHYSCRSPCWPCRAFPPTPSPCLDCKLCPVLEGHAS